MIGTPQEFIDTMRAKIVTTSAKIEIINNDYNDGTMTESGNYAIFEGDGIELDGSLQVIPNKLAENNKPHFYIENNKIQKEGWYSDELSDNEGKIQTDYSKTVKHSRKEYSDLHIIFSDIRNEYAVDFDLGVGTDIYNYRNNTEKQIVIKNVKSGTIIEIEIFKWSKANSRAKILNMYLGTVFQYEDSDIVSIKVKKGVDLTNEDIQSKEVELKIVDENNSYNIFDENSELTSLNNDAKIIIHIGVLIGNFIYYVKTDECYFKKIEKQENELELLITGMGILTKYQTIEWTKLLSMNRLRQDTLEEMKWYITGGYRELHDRIVIDDKLISEAQEFNECYSKNEKIHEYLNSIAINCRSNLVETYDNAINFKRITEEKPVARINLENMENYPQIVKEENKYNLAVNIYNGKTEDIYTEVFSGKFTVGNGGVAHLVPYKNVEFMNYEENPNCEFVINIYNSDGTIYKSNITSYDEYDFSIITYPNEITFITKDNLADKIFELTIKNKTMQYSSLEYKIQEYETNELDKIIDVRSIQDENTAQKVGKWIINNINKRYKFKIKVNDTCTYELGDTVEIETGVYEKNQMIIKTAIIVGIEYEYDGTLDYYLWLKGR